jgi:[ribosomal protein S5]-alanine N-acetyltransferase
MRIDCGVCAIRDFALTDKAALVRQANNAKIWANVRDIFPHPSTDEAADMWLTHATTVEPRSHFAIEVEGAFAGGIGLKLQTDVDRVSAELGYWLGEEFWGRGVATAAITGFVPWAFETFPLERIYAVPFHWNIASCRALERASFNKEGVMRRAALKAGVLADLPLYARYRTQA